MDNPTALRHMHPMSRSDRLYDILQLLHDGALHRAQDIATQTGVSVRTIYRDMDSLVASGIPVQGTRGTGYRLQNLTPIPPLSLTKSELEALNLAIAIISEATDPDLKSAALSLADKIDAALPLETIAPADAWKFTRSPFADAARGFSHMASLRNAIKTRQKLRLICCDPNGTYTMRPLRLENWGRVWIVLGWCEELETFRNFRTDLIEQAIPLPELFVDEPGKRLSDYAP